MKTLYLVAGLTAAFIPASAVAGSISYSKPLTTACYEAAEDRNSNSNSIQRCTRALTTEATIGGDRVATLVNRGILLMLQNESTGAVRDFDEAIALDPSESEAWLGKAVEHWRAGDSAAALELADRALELHTRKPALAYLIRGLSNEERGNVKAAYADLVTARTLAPDWDEPGEQLKRYRVVRR